MFPESCRLCAGKAVKKIDRGREVTEKGQRQGRDRAETGKGQRRDREGAEKGHGQEGPVGHLYHGPLFNWFRRSGGPFVPLVTL